jgi:hypothetical protein
MSHERFSHKPPYRASLFYPECALALDAKEGFAFIAKSGQRLENRSGKAGN